MTGFFSDSRRRLRAEDDGAALLMVVVIVSVLVLLSFIAFVSAGTNEVSVSSYDASTQADATAAAGAVAAVYRIQSSTGTFPCSIPPTSLLPTSEGGLTNAGTSTYKVSIAYYTAYPPSSSSQLACSGGSDSSVSPVPASLHAAVVTSTGKTVVGPVSATETITEQVFVTLAPNDYSVFSGGTGALNVSDLVPVSSSAMPSSEGVVYANGDVTLGPSAACGSPGAPNVNPPSPPAPPASAFYASIIAQGNLSITNCFVDGSVSLGTDPSNNGNLVLSQAMIDGNAVVSGGSATMSDSQIVGNLTAAGNSSVANVVVCPNPLGQHPPTGCSALKAGGSVINGSIAAQGTVTVGTTSEPAGTPPCSPTNTGGDQVVGCITPSSPYAVGGPGDFSLPTLASDSSRSDWFSAWSSAGDTAGNGSASTAAVVTASTCTGTGTGSVWADVNGETGPTVVIANCGISWSSGNLNAPYNTAIVASGGISLSGNFAFTQPPPPKGQQPTAAQISLIVPTPSSSYTCGSSLNVTLGSNFLGPQTQDDSFFVYTPCTLTVSAAVSFIGELVANAVSLTAPVTLTYPPATTPYSPPNFNFGFEVIVESRYVTSGG